VWGESSSWKTRSLARKSQEYYEILSRPEPYGPGRRPFEWFAQTRHQGRPGPLSGRAAFVPRLFRRIKERQISSLNHHGSSFQRAEVVRDLTAHSWDRPLRKQRQPVADTRQVLCAEWAAAVAFRWPRRQVEGLLQEGKATYAK
jgi:hypothetical protein